MNAKPAEPAYTIAQAAAIKNVGADTIRRAVKATTGHVLRAKNISSAANPRYRIPASALDAWFDGLEDA